MAKKIRVTPREVEADIINGIKQGKKQSKASSRRERIGLFIAACLLVIIEFIYPPFFLWLLPALIAFLLVLLPVAYIRRRRHIQRVTMGDYTVQKATVSHTAHEEYWEKSGRRHSRLVEFYTLSFEGGATWQIPEEGYRWCMKPPATARVIYEGAHRGDEFFLVTHKESGEVAVAYHAALFDWCEG